MDQQAVIDATKRWVAGIVIGLDLCPFAKRVFDGELVRYAVTFTEDAETLLRVMAAEAVLLASLPRAKVETTMVIHPCVLGDFLDYNDFLGLAEARLEELGLKGIIQVASFHPAYRFAGTARDAPENYTNRSPYPMLHLLRELSITEVADDPRAQDTPRRNIATMRGLGLAQIQAKLKALREAGDKGRTGP